MRETKPAKRVCFVTATGSQRLILDSSAAPTARYPSGYPRVPRLCVPLGIERDGGGKQPAWRALTRSASAAAGVPWFCSLSCAASCATATMCPWPCDSGRSAHVLRTKLSTAARSIISGVKSQKQLNDLPSRLRNIPGRNRRPTRLKQGTTVRALLRQSRIMLRALSPGSSYRFD